MIAAGGWYFKSKPCRDCDGVIAWCARTPLLGDGPTQVVLGEEVHFEFADTEAAAFDKLKSEVGAR